MSDGPEFSVGEFILSGLFVGAALASLVLTAKLIYDADMYNAMESGGLTIMFFTAVADPINFGMDFMTFPLKLWARSGHETKITTIGAYVGLALFAAGLMLNYTHRHVVP
jgi:hypothetical protein